MALSTLLGSDVTPPVGATSDPRTEFRMSGGRRLVFAFLLLLLLPFFVSLGPMIYARVSQGFWIGTPGLIILGLAFAAIMLLILTQLIYAVRTKVELGDEAVHVTVPQGSGPTPMFRYLTAEVPYSEIAAVETRREFYGGRLAPVLLKGARIVKHDGAIIPLGYVNETNVDGALPFPEIAGKIADRAGLVLVDRGCVRCGTSHALGLIDLHTHEDHLEDFDIARLNRQHTRLMLALIAGLVMLVAGGIAADILA